MGTALMCVRSYCYPRAGERSTWRSTRGTTLQNAGARIATLVLSPDPTGVDHCIFNRLVECDLPAALRAAETELELTPDISRLVLIAGASMNQNGTALFEGVTVLFLAQAYGVTLGIVQQAFVMVISVLAGIGTAGVLAGSLRQYWYWFVCPQKRLG
jgi:Na+/serine symporter